MAQTIKLKRSATSGAVPTTGSLELGEVAINTYDGKMYIKKNDGTESVVEIGNTSEYLPLSGGTMTGSIALSQNPVGTTYGNGVSATPTDMISQVVGDNDGWRLYGEAPSTNDVKMVFEVIDDVETGDTWLFRNKKTYSPYSATTAFKIDGAGNITANGTVTAASGNSTNWNTAYTYSQVGHLPLSGGTLTGALTVNDVKITGSAIGNTAAALTFQPNAAYKCIHPTSLDGVPHADSISWGWSNNKWKDGWFSGVLYANGGNSTNWNTAYSWGDHAGNYLPLTGGTLTGGLTGTTAQFANVGVGASPNIHGLYVYHTDNYEAAKFETNQSGSLARFTDTTASIEIGVQLGKPVIRTGNTARLTVDGANVDINSGALTMAGTTVIDSSRNFYGATFYDSGNSNNYLDSPTSSVFRLNGSSAVNLAVDGSTKLVATSTGIGIGTSSPSANLEISSASNPEISIASTAGATSNFLNFKAISHTQQIQTQLKTIDNGDFTSDLAFLFKAAGTGGALTEKMRIDSSGRVGIGTSSPFGRLSVDVVAGAPASSGNMTNGFTVHNSNGGRAIQLGVNESGAYNYLQSAYVNNANVAVDMAFFTGATERMRIDSSGNVGIGTSSPTSYADRTLHVTGGTGSATLKLSSTSAGNTNADGFDVAHSGVNAYLINRENGPMMFSTNDTERMRIDSSGNLLVGKTYTATGNVGQEFRAGGYTAFTRSGGNPLELKRLASDGSLINFYKDGTSVGSISAQGGNKLVIGSNDTGIRFAQDNDALHPWNATTNGPRDAAIDLGADSIRFKDLYLSGAARASSFVDAGNTGNYLDSPTSSVFRLNGSTAVNLAVGGVTKLVATSTGIGIGTSSPNQKLHISDSAPFARLESTSTSYNGFTTKNDSGNFYFGIDDSGGNFYGSPYARAIYADGAYPVTFYTNAAERMRIDSSGNLLVGKSTSSSATAGITLEPAGAVVATRDGGECFIANRKTSDGAIIQLRKDQTTVGSIQSRAGVVSTIVLDPRTNGAGLTGTQNAVEPTNGSGVNTNGVLSLGTSSSRFKDLYLSGTLNGDKYGIHTEGGGSLYQTDGYLRFANGNTETARIDASGSVTANVDLRAPIFYDSNNTAYYVDPLNTSVMNVVTIGASGGGFIARNPGSQTGSLWLAAASSGTAGANTVSLAGGATTYMTANSTGIDVLGSIEINGTTVIDSSRNLTNIGTANLLSGKFRLSEPVTGATLVRGFSDEYHGMMFRGRPTSNSAYGAADVVSFFEYGGIFEFYQRTPNSYTKLVDFDASGVVNAIGGYKVNGTTVIDSSSNFYGATFYDSDNTSYYVNPESTSNVKGFIFNSGTTLVQATPNIESLASNNTAGNVHYHATFCRNDGTVNGKITTNYYATTYSTTSDYRVKEDIQPMGSATADLMALNPVNFQWVGSNIRTDGFLAHEVAAIVPDAVVGEKDSLDAKGNPDLQGLDQSKLVPLLVKTIQEQQAVIESLEARLTALENA